MKNAAALAVLALVVACGPKQAPPNDNAAPAVAALAAAHASADIAPLLTDDALLIDGDARFTSSADASAELAAAPFTVTSAVDSHHDVLRAKVARGTDERMLFGALDGTRFKLLVIVPLPKDGAATGGAVVDAYQAAWNEGDAVKRGALLDTAWSDDGRYVDPTADVTGRDALVAQIDSFRGSLPGAKVDGTSAVATGDGAVHFRWNTSGLGGLVNVEGMDVGLTGADGRLTLIAGFFGALADAP